MIATAGPDSAGRVAALGAASVLDYHRPDWPAQVRALTEGGVDAAANAVRSGAAQAMQAIRDGGRLATITSDPPAAERDITVRQVFVAPDGRRLGDLIQLLARGALTISVGGRSPSSRAPQHWAGSATGPAGRPSCCSQETRLSRTHRRLRRAPKERDDGTST